MAILVGMGYGILGKRRSVRGEIEKVLKLNFPLSQLILGSDK